MSARIGLANVPRLGQPKAVTQAIEEATGLQGRLRAAREEAAAAQQTVDQLEREDIESAAARAREGATSLGAPLPALAKARTKLDDLKRVESALSLAAEGASDDLASAITASASIWIASCDDAETKAREAGRRALDAVSESIEKVRDAASTKAWITSAISDGRYDRPAPSMVVGSMAPSSRKLTANSEALEAGVILGLAAELIGTS